MLPKLVPYFMKHVSQSRTMSYLCNMLSKIVPYFENHVAQSCPKSYQISCNMLPKVSMLPNLAQNCIQFCKTHFCPDLPKIQPQQKVPPCTLLVHQISSLAHNHKNARTQITSNCGTHMCMCRTRFLETSFHPRTHTYYI